MDAAIPSRQRPPRRPLRSRLLLLAGAFAVLAAALEIGLRAATRDAGGRAAVWFVPLLPLAPDGDALAAVRAGGVTADRYHVDDPELGWVVAPNARRGPYYTSNAQGARAAPDRVYDRAVPAGKTRILTFGDSFTHGDEVELAATWQVRMESREPGLEVVNFGVSAYGMDQAFLRCRRELAHLHADVVLLCVWPEDVARCLNVYRFLLTGGTEYVQKPRFVVDANGALRLVNSPLEDPSQRFFDRLQPPVRLPPHLLALDRWYVPGDFDDPWWYASRTLRVAASAVRKIVHKRELDRVCRGEDDEGLRVTTAIARAFVQEVRAVGAEPHVLLMPLHEHLREHPGGAHPLPLVRHWLDAGLPIVDLSPALANDAACFLPSGHLAPDGHAAVADALLALLRLH